MSTKPIFPLSGKRVWVAGHGGMVGKALMSRLATEDCEILTVDRSTLDLRRQAETESWVKSAKPDSIILAAARVGGIYANDTYPAEFIYDNLAIQTNIIEAARKCAVSKLLFLGSSCIYPKFSPQPIVEEALLTGSLEPTNEWYAIAKIAGLKQIEAYRKQYGCDFISAMPTNLYGPGDNFHPMNSHVVPALIRRAHVGKSDGSSKLVVWGTGAPRRELLYVDDCADALVYLLKHYSDDSHVNVGSGEEFTITQLVGAIVDVVGFKGEIVFDRSKPDGTPRKLLNSSRLRGLGWEPRTPLRAGLRRTYKYYLEVAA